ncbi:MAG: hypothetical protein U1F19_04720 [Lysobacterales bacterium]
MFNEVQKADHFISPSNMCPRAMLVAEARSPLSWRAKWLPLVVAVIAALQYRAGYWIRRIFFFADDWG